MSIIDQLRQKKDFTGVECDIADYILAHPDEVTTLSIASLAEKTYTSNATIIRLCHKLGIKGYRDFRIMLSRELEKRLVEKHTVDVDAPVLPSQETATIMSNIAQLSKEAINTCYASISTTDVRRVALAITRAHHVFIYARGDSELSALLFANQLMKLGIYCIDASRFSEGSAIAKLSQNGDVALIVSYSGATLAHMKVELNILRQRGCKTVLISSAEKPANIDLAIRFSHQESDEAKVATYYSQTCIRYILNCVYGQVFALGDRESVRRKIDVDSIVYADVKETCGH